MPKEREGGMESHALTLLAKKMEKGKRTEKKRKVERKYKASRFSLKDPPRRAPRASPMMNRPVIAQRLSSFPENRIRSSLTIVVWKSIPPAPATNREVICLPNP